MLSKTADSAVSALPVSNNAVTNAFSAASLSPKSANVGGFTVSLLCGSEEPETITTSHDSEVTLSVLPRHTSIVVWVTRSDPRSSGSLRDDNLAPPEQAAID